MVEALALVMLAPVIGSFLGVLVRRLPAGQDVVWRPSACEACGQVLAARDMAPVISFVAGRGACRYCGSGIAPEHLAIELAAVGVGAWAWFVDAGPMLWWSCGLGWALLTLAWIDWRHFRLPDVLTLPLVLAGLAAAGWGGEWGDGVPAVLADHAAGAATGYLGFRAVGGVYRWLRGRDGLGQGDAKLLAAGGAWLGLGLLPTVIVAAALLGLCHALIAGYRIAAPNWRVSGATAIPFGPALALAIWLVWLYARPDTAMLAL